MSHPNDQLNPSDAASSDPPPEANEVNSTPQQLNLANNGNVSSMSQKALGKKAVRPDNAITQSPPPVPNESIDSNTPSQQQHNALTPDLEKGDVGRGQYGGGLPSTSHVTVEEILNASGRATPDSTVPEDMDISKLILLARLFRGLGGSANDDDGGNPNRHHKNDPPPDEDADRDPNPPNLITSPIDLIVEGSYPPAIWAVKDFPTSPPSMAGEYTGLPFLRAMDAIVYEDTSLTNGVGHLIWLEHLYFLKLKLKRYPPGYLPLPKEYATHVLSLVTYLEGVNDEKSATQFTASLETSGSRPVLQIAEAWSIFLDNLGFGSYQDPVPDPSISFQQYLTRLFPRSKTKRESFSITLSDIVDAGLDVQPASDFRDHLSIEGLRGERSFNSLVSSLILYRTFDLSTLGKEILGSLYVLCEPTTQLCNLAKTHDLRPIEEGGPDLLSKLTAAFLDVKPDVLSGKLDKLEALIRRQNVWWRIMHREILKYQCEQPLKFWGAILAALFSITTIIQTVMSIVSTIYTIRSYHIALAALAAVPNH